jgi:hypothetical protein
MHLVMHLSVHTAHALVYLVFSQSSAASSTLVLSRAKVAPIKKVSIPRLELLGALIAAQLIKLVIEALRLPDSVPYRCWTDSMVALGWIKGNPVRWKQFVANRVQSIQELTCPS